MSKRTATVISVVLLFFLAIAAAVALTQSEDRNEVSASPTPTVSASPSARPSPSPEAVEVQGTVQSISPNPVAFMNARIIRVQELSGITQVYVTDSTQIESSGGTLITLNGILSGDRVQVTGEAVEGGVLASQITVEQRSTPTPTATATPTPRPTSTPTPTPAE